MNLAWLSPFLLISTIEGQTFPSPLFDCTRTSQNCPTGGICGAPSKSCVVCPSGKYGYACHIDYADLAGGETCNVTCTNGGTCLADKITCRCDPGYTGTLCDEPTIGLNCGDATPGDDSSMTIDISKLIGIDSATPQLIVEDSDPNNSNDDVCFGGSGVKTLTVKNNYQDGTKSNACNMAAASTENDITKYTRKFIVRFAHGSTIPDTDFRITAVCGPQTSATESVDIQHAGNVGTSLKNHDVSNTVAGAKITLQLMVDSAPLDIDTQYSIKATIDVILTLDTTSGEFKAIRLEDFKVDNGNDTNTFLQLMAGGCPTKHERIVVKTRASKTVPYKITLQTVPVIMDGSNKNHYTFIMKVCPKEQETLCEDVSTCNIVRRKRSARDDIATLDAEFAIKDDVQQDDKRNDNQKECAMSTLTSVSFIAMAVAILFLLVLVVILIIHSTGARSRDVIAYQNHDFETASTTSFPTKMDNTIY